MSDDIDQRATERAEKINRVIASRDALLTIVNQLNAQIERMTAASKEHDKPVKIYGVKNYEGVI
jgi:hypothetical protein